jgi:hypothetical protein
MLFLLTFRNVLSPELKNETDTCYFDDFDKPGDVGSSCIRNGNIFVDV